MAKVMELRGMIHAKYNSESEFARYLGWPRQKLSRITTGRKEPDLSELSQISMGLDKSLDEVANIFLRQESPNGQLSV